MTTSPSPGSGSSTSDQTSTSGPPGAVIVTAYTSVSSRYQALPCLAGQTHIRLDVAGADRLDHVGRDDRTGGGLVPAGRQRPVPDGLLVERPLGPAGFPVVGRPEAGRVRGQQLVGQDEGTVG